MDKKIIIGFIIVIVLMLGGIIALTAKSTSSGPDLTAFAQCLKEKGATFYGAFWCPHCQATKKMFGAAASSLPYVECSTPDGQGQNQICRDLGIQQYPTWVFADGSRMTGELTLAQLSEKTGCQVPGAPAVSPVASISPAPSSASSAVISGSSTINISQ